MSEPYAKKSLGQHWLHDKPSLNAMCQSAEVAPDDVILEVGPGTGELTKQLLTKTAKVIALELDQQLVTYLLARFASVAGNKLDVQNGDIRTYDLSKLPSSYKIVANIPYYLTANLMRLLTDTPYKPQVVSLLVQKEVAQRVAATPGKMSQLAVFVQLYYDVSLGQLVPAKLFTPPPKVDSQILVLKNRGKPLYDVQQKPFFKLVKAGFSSPRKKLRSSLSAGLQQTKPQIEQLLNKANVDPNARAQQLSLKDWHNIYLLQDKS